MRRHRREAARTVARRTAGVMIGAALALGAGASAQAGGQGTIVSHGMLSELNASGVSGSVTVLDKGGHLRVNLDVAGLEVQQAHLQHIHGFGDGLQATCPGMDLAGPDGVLAFADGLPAYGPPMITLGHDPVDDGTLAYSRTFGTTMAGDPVAALGELDQYVVVLHGLTVDGAFVPSLPVACAVLTINGSR